MTVTKIADKILEDLVENFHKTGDEGSHGELLVEAYPDIEPHLIFKAVYMLERDGLLIVCHSDDEPGEIALDINAFRHMDENTLLKKGYRIAKEVRDWLK